MNPEQQGNLGSDCVGDASKTALPVGALRVWWIPQIPGKPFHVRVSSPREARFLMDALGDYDLFQFNNRIKPDYANAGGLEIYEADGGDGAPDWCEWYDPDTGDDIDAVDFDRAACEAVSGAVPSDKPESASEVA